MHILNAPAVTAERLDAAIDLVSEVMVLHNRPCFAPYVERLERELAALQANNDVMTRARQRLEQRRAANNNSHEVEAA
ncbi:hypothetical protein [Bradyrhizobium australafricanum]|uniref:hypothetical protein n=1 Tax=Bradyrhizobium australafricanum TaxID=2821406 RepID=UPI001CE30907|nr:hypothetical protein [Bradyrhizobium australafricanum]MCA6098847.1 hypothetical protein [Bradyrhizobium australafricanum]